MAPLIVSGENIRQWSLLDIVAVTARAIMERAPV